MWRGQFAVLAILWAAVQVLAQSTGSSTLQPCMITLDPTQSLFTISGTITQPAKGTIGPLTKTEVTSMAGNLQLMLAGTVAC
jgi:hypothetical protein